MIDKEINLKVGVSLDWNTCKKFIEQARRDALNSAEFKHLVSRAKLEGAKNELELHIKWLLEGKAEMSGHLEALIESEEKSDLIDFAYTCLNAMRDDLNRQIEVAKKRLKELD